MSRGRQRQYLLRICTSVEAFEFVPIMAELSENDVLSPEVKLFFQAKANELKHRQDAVKLLGEM